MYFSIHVKHCCNITLPDCKVLIVSPFSILAWEALSPGWPLHETSASVWFLHLSPHLGSLPLPAPPPPAHTFPSLLPSLGFLGPLHYHPGSSLKRAPVQGLCGGILLFLTRSLTGGRKGPQRLSILSSDAVRPPRKHFLVSCLMTRPCWMFRFVFQQVLFSNFCCNGSISTFHWR